MIKVVAPNMALPGDRLGDAGARRRRRVATTSRWPAFYAGARTLRFADGPDEVHRNAIAKIELGKHALRRCRLTRRCSASASFAAPQRLPGRRRASATSAAGSSPRARPTRRASSAAVSNSSTAAATSVSSALAQLQAQVDAAAQRHQHERRLVAQPGAGGALEGVAERPVEPGRPFVGRLETPPKLCAGSSSRSSASSGTSPASASPRASSSPISVWLLCGELLEGLASRASPSAAVEHEQHLQVGRQAELHAQAQLVAGDVGALRRAPFEPPGRAVELAVDRRSRRRRARA